MSSLTKLASIINAIADCLGITAAQNPEMSEIEQDVAREAVLDAIAARQEAE